MSDECAVNLGTKHSPIHQKKHDPYSILVNDEW